MRRYRVRNRRPNTAAPSTSSNNLIMVPIHIDLLSLAADTEVAGVQADFTRLPYQAGGKQFNADVANVAESILAEPFEHKHLLKKGVHLHWALPDYFMQGRQDDNGAIVYPVVPNRWLVRKVDSAHAGTTQQWLVESDYLYPVGETPADTSVFPFDVQSGQPYRYIGRFRPYTPDLKSNPHDDCLDNLTAAGFGIPDFAAFYPNCQSVFGFFDEGQSAGFEASASDSFYEVLGWFADKENDPVTTLVKGMVQPDYQSVKTQIQQIFGWQLDDKSAVIPQKMLCFGRVMFSQSGEAD